MTRNRAGRPAADPFAVLALPAEHALTDDDVRAAWRRIAAATHPDRADGGDPDAFAAAAAAYTALRTRSARGEILADRDAGRGAGLVRAGLRVMQGIFPYAGGRPPRHAIGARLRGGRPGRLGLRVLAAAAVCAGAVAAVGWHPAAPALITGALTWLIITGRRELAPPRPPGRGRPPGQPGERP